jgi:hypothetical protein
VAATKGGYREKGNPSAGKRADLALNIGARNTWNKPAHPPLGPGRGQPLMFPEDPEPVFRRIEKQVFYNPAKPPKKNHLEGKTCRDSVVGWCSSRKRAPASPVTHSHLCIRGPFFRHPPPLDATLPRLMPQLKAQTANFFSIRHKLFSGTNFPANGWA